MALTTSFTELMAVRHPVALAPMGDCAGGALTAAVSNGGGLGLIGGGRGRREVLERECALVTERTALPWGVGLLTWAVDEATVAWVLERRPAALVLSFGDPTPFASRVRAADVTLIVQVADLDGAKQALDAGADVVIAQGSEAGGHTGGPGSARATLPFVPAVVDIAGATPVLAAGGIADGRGLAAALALGAAGALVGTRFQVTPEALSPPEALKAIIDGRGGDTGRSRVLDVAADAGWPARYPARTLRNAFWERWDGREDELERDADARRAFRDGVARGDLDVLPVWASEAIDLITGTEPAAELVGVLVAEAERALDRVRRT
ncbi:NAD(P)H-dependent flavin oxidoreductase [Pseudonocardia sp. GCM10023141]|uniref:NAD(P)H-dependent flavin oxidoreductase n=1 Tax=Pseudonocardia sp. GCM10023141 TaxID=3252653 RepID=UPI003616AD9C